MGIPGSKNGGTVPYKAIYWGYIPLHSPLWALYMFPVPGSPPPPPMVWSPKNKNPSLPAACHVSICLVCPQTSYRHTTPQGGRGGK